MKNIFRKTLSLFLASALLCAVVLPAAASEALGSELTSKDTLLSSQTQLSTNVFWSESRSDFQTENLITYYPNTAVTPIVTYGSVLTEKTTVTDAAHALEGYGHRVVAGINGDFYIVGSGVPVGLVITYGQLRSSDGGFHAIGFRADGSAVLGQPGISLSAVFTDEAMEGGQTALRPVAVNKGRDNTGVFLYTHDFNASHTTGTTQPGVDVVCTILEGSLSVGGTLTAVVDQVAEAASATDIGPNQLVLSANLAADAAVLEQLRSIPAGASLTITTTAAAGGWEDVEFAVGGLYSLVEDGVMASGLDTTAAPRTAVGQRPDGSVIFYTIDGRKSGHSVGASMTQAARRMMELGCVTALCMDGGGSTTISVTDPDKTTARTLNTPSDGTDRAVTNHIFLVASSVPTGELDHFHVTSDYQYVLAGSKVRITAAAIDTNYIPMENVDYRLSADDGELEGNVLTTPGRGGTITVTAGSRGSEGSVTVYAVETPDAVSILQNGAAVPALNAAPGSMTALTAAASYRHTPLHADPEAFTWTVEGDIGEIDEMGVFTAGDPGSGAITVSAGGQSASIPVTVSSLTYQTLEDFEGTTTIFRGTGANMSYSLTSAADDVRLGRGAGKLEYTFSQEGGYVAEWRAANPSALAAAPYVAVNLWVRGDGSNSDLSLLLRNSDGTESVLPLGTLDDTGWRQISASLPEQGGILLGLRITPQGYEEDGVYPDTSGTVYIDHIAASYDGGMDNVVPSVTLTPELDSLTAVISDDRDGVLPQSSISVLRDGAPQEFTYTDRTGALTTTAISDGDPHRITVIARDASGNIGRASYDVPTGSDWQHRFTDIQDYWAADFVDYLYTAGITTGYDDGTFRPSQNITRAQFSAMLYRYLGLDEADYADTVLPFADNDSIPSYATAAVRALYARGIINGAAGQDGKLYFNPNNSLSRAQAAAMIGRTQEKGYATVELSFTDAASIPGYAAFYIQTMAAQGVLSGYSDGTFLPNNSITRGQMAKILYNLM